MLPTKADPIRVALNRVTFGARDLDVATVQASGWPAWVTDQLAPPVGDDPNLAAFLANQTLHIEYTAGTGTQGSWAAVKEDRPLNYLNADPAVLWNIGGQAGVTIASNERLRISQELAAATWIRNTHSHYQLREFMTDFWHNHFNIGKVENALATALLPVYDRAAIRPNVFGNFRALLEANATSSSMLIYLDNWVSTATTPNENYGSEIMELHTLGGAAYYGTASGTLPTGINGTTVGFTDADVVQASRAMSGWTIQYGQRGASTALPNNGLFIYNAAQHNTQAGTLLGIDISKLTGSMAQGRKFLDMIAYHPATATFICTKLAKRIFGDTPPQSVIDRAVAMWNNTQLATDQIGQVLHSILLDGDEIMTAPIIKVRRPYERIIALARTTDMVVNASTVMTSVLDPLNDGLFAWQAPNGRPDTNAYWLATGATIATWNLLLQVPYYPEIKTSLAMETPLSAAATATGVVEYWVERMVGMELSASAMNMLISDQATSVGVPSLLKSNSAVIIESAYRRLISLIATAEEFSLR